MPQQHRCLKALILCCFVLYITWMTIGGAASPPPEPGLYMMTFPTWSCFHFRPVLSAKSFNHCKTLLKAEITKIVNSWFVERENSLVFLLNHAHTCLHDDSVEVSETTRQTSPIALQVSDHQRRFLASLQLENHLKVWQLLILYICVDSVQKSSCFLRV